MGHPAEEDQIQIVSADPSYIVRGIKDSVDESSQSPSVACDERW